VPKWGSHLDLGDVAEVDRGVFVADVKAAGQRYSHRTFTKFIRLACALKACCVHMGSRNRLYIVVFRASSHVQVIPSEPDLL